MSRSWLHISWLKWLISCLHCGFGFIRFWFLFFCQPVNNYFKRCKLLSKITHENSQDFLLHFLELNCINANKNDDDFIKCHGILMEIFKPLGNSIDILTPWLFHRLILPFSNTLNIEGRSTYAPICSLKFEVKIQGVSNNITASKHPTQN